MLALHREQQQLANGSVGYVPDRAAYAQGNYEVVSVRCAEAAVRLLKGMAAGR